MAIIIDNRSVCKPSVQQGTGFLNPLAAVIAFIISERTEGGGGIEELLDTRRLLAKLFMCCIGYQIQIKPGI